MAMSIYIAAQIGVKLNSSVSKNYIREEHNKYFNENADNVDFRGAMNLQSQNPLQILKVMNFTKSNARENIEAMKAMKTKLKR
jgi:hypothetical protein